MLVPELVFVVSYHIALLNNFSQCGKHATGIRLIICPHRPTVKKQSIIMKPFYVRPDMIRKPYCVRPDI